MEPLKILYGVNGEGLGHATRSEVVIGSLLARHDVRVVARAPPSGSSGRACRAWTRSSARASPWRTARSGAGRPSGTTWPGPARPAGHGPPLARHRGPLAARRRHHRLRAVRGDLCPHAQVPLMCVDNIHMSIAASTTRRSSGPSKRLHAGPRRDPGDGADRGRLPDPHSSSPDMRGRTKLIAPIVRPEVVAAAPIRGDHLLVYSSGEPRCSTRCARPACRASSTG